MKNNWDEKLENFGAELFIFEFDFGAQIANDYIWTCFPQ